MSTVRSKRSNIIICSVILVFITLLAIFVGCGDKFIARGVISNFSITSSNRTISGYYDVERADYMNGRQRLSTLNCEAMTKIELELKDVNVISGKISFYIVDGDYEMKVVSSEAMLGGEANIGFYEVRTNKKLKLMTVAEEFKGTFRLEIRGQGEVSYAM